VKGAVAEAAAARVDELLDEAAQALIEEAVGEEPAAQLPL
jgi:hypothetical protein